MHIRALFFSAILSGFLVLTVHDSVNAQMSVSPHNIALGGGVAYSSGLSAHFTNPANLLIRDDLRRHQVSLGLGGVYHSNGSRIARAPRLPNDMVSHFLPDSPAARNAISESDLRRMFSNSDRYHMTRSYEMVPMGYSWSNGTRARSLAVRSRGLTSFEMNSSWFSATDVSDDSEAALTRYINESYQVYHEVSFAIAREVTMLNQWQAGLNTLYIGLAPKLLVGGMYSQAEYTSEYHFADDNWQNSGNLHLRQTGDLNHYLSDLLRTGDADQAFRNHLSPSSNFKSGGAGFGIDAGLTYIIPLGDDVSLSPHIEAPLKKSLRLSIALTDLGFIRYHNQPAEWQSRNITRVYSELPETNIVFSGKPGELIRYIHQDSGEDSALENLAKINEDAFYVQLPTKLHIGTALQYNWVTTTADLNYRFNSSDYKTNGWRVSLGTELRLLRFLPVMGSIQLNPGGKAALGAGAGLDFGVVRASGAFRVFRINHGMAEWHVDSLSSLALQVRF